MYIYMYTYVNIYTHICKTHTHILWYYLDMNVTLYKSRTSTSISRVVVYGKTTELGDLSFTVSLRLGSDVDVP